LKPSRLLFPVRKAAVFSALLPLSSRAGPPCNPASRPAPSRATVAFFLVYRPPQRTLRSFPLSKKGGTFCFGPSSGKRSSEKRTFSETFPPRAPPLRAITRAFFPQPTGGDESVRPPPPTRGRSLSAGTAFTPAMTLAETVERPFFLSREAFSCRLLSFPPSACRFLTRRKRTPPQSIEK